MEPREFLEGALRGLLKARGFKKRGSTWRAYHPESILVVNMQKSQWGSQFYVNLGVYFRALGEHAAPRESHCHLRTRLSTVLTDSFLLVKALDFESDMADQERADAVRRAVEEAALPWLVARQSEQGARAMLLAEEHPRGLVTGSARQLLGVPCAESKPDT